MQSCMTCRREDPIQRISMGNHKFCSAACVVKYAGTNKDAPWLKSETYQMYYELDFDERIKGTLSGQDKGDEEKDTGYQAVPSTTYAPVQTVVNTGPTGPNETLATKESLVRGVEGSQGRDGTTICLCRSGVLDVLKKRKAIAPSSLDNGQKPRQNCADKTCACFNVLPKGTGSKS
jgi:hypothetical protein